MNAFERFKLHVAPGAEAANTSTLIIAVLSNLLVAAAKSVTALLTRSPSMFAEAVHSWVDLGNEGFIIAAFRTASRPSDDSHPLGYGRESYVWSLFASLGVLLLGAVANVWHGITQLGDPDAPAEHVLIAYVVLALSFVFEGVSFVQTYLRVRKAGEQAGLNVFEQAFTTSDSPLRAVFVEDGIALVSLVIAAVGISVHAITGRGLPDAIGSIAIGALLAVAGLILVNNNRLYLQGKAMPKHAHAIALEMLASQPEVERVTFLYGEIIGPERVLLLAGIVIKGERTQTELAYLLRDIERRLMQHRFVGLAMLSLATPEEDAAKL